MTKSVIVSVLVPAYNAELYIGRCIRSLLNQTLSDESYEIIVVNDFSKDNTKKVISTFTGDIRYFENKKRLGLPGSLNFATKKAKGQFVVRVDSDDWVHPEFLNVLSLHLRENNSLDAVASDYYLVNNDQDNLEYKNCEKNPIGCGIMFRLENLIKIGLYDEKFLAREDEDLIRRFKKYFNVTRVPVPLYKYRQHKNNMTKNKKLMKKFLKKINHKYK